MFLGVFCDILPTPLLASGGRAVTPRLHFLPTMARRRGVAALAALALVVAVVLACLPGVASLGDHLPHPRLGRPPAGQQPPKTYLPNSIFFLVSVGGTPPTPTPRPQPHRHPRCRNAPRPRPANRGRRHCGHLRHLRRRRLFRRSSRAAPPRPVGRVLATLREARGPMPPLGDEQGVIRCSGWLPNPTLLRMDCRAAAGPCVRSEPAARRPHLGHPQNVYEHLAGPL
jgi:hypothetical protein